MAFTTRPEVKGTFGVASSTHWLASQCAMTVLDRGGNAFDAACAAGFVLQVVEPHLNGLGGEVPILLWDTTRGRAEVVCGQGPAPATATIAHVRELELAEIPGTGLIAACVPGAFGGWMALLRDHGTWRLADILQFAIGYAESGYPLLPRIVDTLTMVEPLFREHWPTSAATYLEGGMPRSWQLFRNRDLASTYRRLVREAESSAGGREEQIEAATRSFYSGFVAEAVEQHCRGHVMDSSGTPHPGFLTAADMAAFKAGHEEPVSTDFAGWTVAKCGPWSQGPVFLQQLRLLEPYELGAKDFLSAEHLHLVTECAKLAFADREAWYADPDFAQVPLAELLSPEYAEARRRLVGDRASAELRPGSPSGMEPRLPRRDAQAVRPGHWTGTGSQSLGAVRGDTVHVAVADRHGNLVACTPSGGWLQSSPVIAGLGFCLGTRAQMFNLDPGHPNHLEGGKRPRTTLSPSLALRDGAPRLAFGTPGGDQQDQWTLEFFLAHTLFGLDLQAAIDAPMFHTSHFPSSFAPHDAHPGRLHSEPMPSGVLEDLRRRGHEVVEAEPWSLGRTCAVGIESQTGLLSAAANPRGGQAYAVGR
ncbi:MAG: gamma-glutamyltransferase family protein [Chloroflexi bacterium]|nr:MAG: gamma-glutamyltransferase family protein [Chloroflexota bacterium]TME49612.1 MAG: gamma-glutamyltransferase family protein [Chloroflexota bacterium]